MDDDDNSFSQVIENLKALSTERDPRLIRLAAVTAALGDVAGESPPPTKFFASAIETLEGTLHQNHQEANTILDSLVTQMALLDIISLTVPHVAPGMLAATAPLTSRVLRGVVHSCRSIGVQEMQSIILDTQDGLGGVSSLLCSSCKAVSELLRNLPSVVDNKIIANLLNATLVSLLKDTRGKVKTTAVNEICGLLAMESPKCHVTIRNETTKYIKREIEKSLQDLTGDASTDFVDLLGFLQHSVMFLDFTAIGSRLMEIFLSLLTDSSSKSSSRPVFVTKFKDTRKQILILNAILSTILAMLEHDIADSKKKSLGVFASRVLASLVQVQPTLTFRYGAVEDDLIDSGRSIFGQVMLSACQKIISYGELETGSKLLPLMIQHVVNLSRPSDDLSDYDIAETLMPELSQLFRMHLKDLQNKNLPLYNKCSQNCLAAMELILHSSFQTTWTVSLKPFVILLQGMDSQNDSVKSCIDSMVKLRCEVADNPTFCHAMDDAISSLIQDRGIETFMDQIRLTSRCIATGESIVWEDILPWLLRLMKTAGSLGGNYDLKLSFFQENVLPLARHYDALSFKEQSRSSSRRSLVLGVWALFPCFCRNPTDLDSSLTKIAPLLVRAMNDMRYPELVVLICKGLNTLATGVSERLLSLEELSEGDDAKKIHLEAKLVGSMSEKIIPSLFKLIETLHVSQTEDSMGDDAGESGPRSDNTEEASRVRAVTEAIASLARLASKQLVQSLFSKVLQRLLEASQADDDLSEKMCLLLTLAQALVISETLDHSSISLLYRSLKPLIRTDQTKPRIQKRAYKVLAEICNRCKKFIQEDRNQLKDMLELLSSSMATSQVSARFMRIKCLNSIVKSLENPTEADQRLISGLLGETLLSLKDSNGKTREAAFVLLLSMAEMQEDLDSFIRLVTAAVASKTTHMQSAAVVALSRLVFAYSDDFSVQSLLPSLLKTVLILSDDPSREVAKSMVGFVRVAVVVIPPDQLQPLLPDILHGLLKYHRGKDRFRAKIKIIIKKLVKLYGYDTLMPLVPQSESRLLTHMRKLSEREARRKAAGRVSRKPQATEFDDMIASDEEDSDDGRTLFTGATGMSRMTNQTGRRTKKRGAASIAHTQKSKGDVTVRIRNDTEGTKFDVRDLTQKSVRFADSHSNDSDEDSVIQFDDSGKLIVRDEFAGDVENHEMLLDDKDSKLGYHKRSLSKPTDSKKSKKKDRQAKLGSSYKARTAGGDVKKKGQKYDPYAYVPLDGRSYTKKNRHLAVEQMTTVVQRGRKRQKR